MMLRDTHGTLTCYNHRKCRCGPCRAAAAEYRHLHPRDRRNVRPGMPKNHHRVWSTDELMRLDHLAGQKPAIIAKELGRTVDAVRRRLEAERNQRGALISVREAADVYCPGMTVEGAWKRIRALIDSGKVRAWRSSWQSKNGGHWRIDPSDLEKYRDELAAPRKTWKCDERQAG